MFVLTVYFFIFAVLYLSLIQHWINYLQFFIYNICSFTNTCFRDVGFSPWAEFYTNMWNCDRVMATKVNFQNGGRRHVGFFGSEIWRQPKSRPTRIYISTPNLPKISKGGRVMTIYVFSKWRSVAILFFCGSKIWKYFCFRDVGFSVWAKFCANMCNCDRVMAVTLSEFSKWRPPPSWISRKWNLTSPGVTVYLPPHQILWR